MRNKKSAAKVLHQTAKTCQYLKENYKKMHFFLIYDENFHLLRSGDKKAAPSEGAAGGVVCPHKCERSTGLGQFIAWLCDI